MSAKTEDANYWRAVRKSRYTQHRDEWMIYATPAEYVAMVNRGVKFTNSSKWTHANIIARHQRGDSGAIWLYFHVVGVNIIADFTRIFKDIHNPRY